MNKLLNLTILILSVNLAGCEYVSYKEWALPAYDGDLDWHQIIEKAEWPERFDHAAVAFDGKLWVMGGYNPGQVKGDTYYEDVWSSSDGRSWELVLEDAP